MGELIVASGNAAPVLEAAESALNDIPGSIGDCVNGMLALAGRVVGDDRLVKGIHLSLQLSGPPTGGPEWNIWIWEEIKSSGRA